MKADRLRSQVFLLASFALAAQTPEENAWQTLNRALNDANPNRRMAAVSTMGVIRPEPRSAALVESMLDDKDLSVRALACGTLGEMQAKRSIPKLAAALNDKAPEVVFAAAKALYALGDPSGRQVLESVLTGDRRDASGLIDGSLHDAKLRAHDPRGLLLLGLKEGAGVFGFGLGVPIAEQLLRDGAAPGKTAALLLLATDTTQESKLAIREALSDKNWTVRVAALRATAQRDIADFYNDVAPLLDDKRDEVRFAAASAMIRLKQRPPRAVSRTK